MPHTRKALSEETLKALIEESLADEILQRIPVLELTQQKKEEVRSATRVYLGKQSNLSFDIEASVRTLLPGLISELGVVSSTAPLYSSSLPWFRESY